jgi:DNA-binding transcriptional LysR family regulator
MDIELLKTFLEVTESRHFGRAAENLFLTPAAVSARIRQLEQMLGVTLLHRTRGNIQVTTEGERLLPHARKLLLAWADTLDDLSLKLEQDNRFSIGAQTSIWRCKLPLLSQSLIALIENHSLNLESHSHTELVAQVLAQQLDIAFLLDLPQHPELHTLKIAELQLALFTSSTTGTDDPQIIQSSYLHLEWSAAFAAFHTKRVSIEKPLLRTTDAAVALSLMEQMGCSAYLPTSMSTEALPLRQISSAPRFTQPIYLIYKMGREHEEKLGQFLQQLTRFEV